MDNIPIAKMNDSERLQLAQMVRDNNSVDQTELIRRVKQSAHLLGEAESMHKIVEEYPKPLVRPLLDEARERCAITSNWLFQIYPDIFTRLLKSELSMELFRGFVGVLKKIEDGELDQHEATFHIGTVLKQMFVDSALKRSEKLDAAAAAQNAAEAEAAGTATTATPKVIKENIKDISWKDYKAKCQTERGYRAAGMH